MRSHKLDVTRKPNANESIARPARGKQTAIYTHRRQSRKRIGTSLVLASSDERFVANKTEHGEPGEKSAMEVGLGMLCLDQANTNGSARCPCVTLMCSGLAYPAQLD
jgi:hypothetical protein